MLVKNSNMDTFILFFYEHLEEEQLNVWGEDTIFCDTDLQ